MDSGRTGTEKHFSPVCSSESGTEHFSSEILNSLILAKAVKILNLYADMHTNCGSGILSSSFTVSQRK